MLKLGLSSIFAISLVACASVDAEPATVENDAYAGYAAPLAGGGEPREDLLACVAEVLDLQVGSFSSSFTSIRFDGTSMVNTYEYTFERTGDGEWLSTDDEGRLVNVSIGDSNIVRVVLSDNEGNVTRTIDSPLVLCTDADQANRRKLVYMTLRNRGGDPNKPARVTRTEFTGDDGVFVHETWISDEDGVAFQFSTDQRHSEE